MKIAQVSKRKQVLSVLGMIFLVATGFYILVVSYAPELNSIYLNPKDNNTTKALGNGKILTNQLYIPKIDVSVPYGNSEEFLKEGAWWRKKGNGSPTDGGNFVLAAHRFEMGLTPSLTIRKSPFFNLNKLSSGDLIIIDNDNYRYDYKVEKVYLVKPEDVQIEERTSKEQLTLYSCTLGGKSDGRIVVVAKPVAK